MEEDTEFVYLALERCRHSLNDLMGTADGPSQFVDQTRRPSAFCMQVLHPHWPLTAQQTCLCAKGASMCEACSAVLMTLHRLCPLHAHITVIRSPCLQVLSLPYCEASVGCYACSA